jgi:hypothetical protein
MRLDPAMGAEVHGDAGAEQAEGDGERSDDPIEIDAALEDEEVQDAEDEHEHGRLGEECGATPSGDHRQVEERGWLSRGRLLRRRNEAQAGGVLGWVSGLWREDGWGVWCVFVKHKRPL